MQLCFPNILTPFNCIFAEKHVQNDVHLVMIRSFPDGMICSEVFLSSLFFFNLF